MTLDDDLSRAVTWFWSTRNAQVNKAMSAGLANDGRSAVVAGKHLDEFARLIESHILETGVSAQNIFWKAKATRALPGYFRPTKEWDLLVVRNNRLLAAIEMKSQVGSFGNNANNRAEEAVGSGYDLQRAHYHGAFGDTLSPWLGYFFLLEERDGARGSVHEVTSQSLHFPVLPELAKASYIDRVRELCRRLVSENLYDAAWFLLTKPDGNYQHPDPQLSGGAFLEALKGHLRAQLVAES